MREQEFPKRLEDLMFNFNDYLNNFHDNILFRKYGQFEFHVATIEKRKEMADALTAVSNPDFIKLLWDVLRSWGIGSRGSHLVGFAEFMASFEESLEDYIELDDMKIDENFGTEENVVKKIYSLIDSLSIVTNKTKLVPCSKALHHIFPELIVPMDRTYTQLFFMFNNQEFQNNQYTVFKQAYKTFMRIARSVKPEQYVGYGWNTSQTKVIDNAIIGYCLSNKIA